jgi:hypothetical protein
LFFEFENRKFWLESKSCTWICPKLNSAGSEFVTESHSTTGKMSRTDLLRFAIKWNKPEQFTYTICIFSTKQQLLKPFKNDSPFPGQFLHDIISENEYSVFHWMPKRMPLICLALDSAISIWISWLNPNDCANLPSVISNFELQSYNVQLIITNL